MRLIHHQQETFKVPQKKKSYFTITEASKTLKISRQAVHEAIHRGSLKAKEGLIIQRTQGWKIDAKSLESYKKKTDKRKK